MNSTSNLHHSRQQQKPYRESADTYRTSEPFASIDRSYEEKKVFARDADDFASAVSV